MTISPETITNAIHRRDLESLPISDDNLLELEEGIIEAPNDDLAGQMLHLLNQIRLCRADVMLASNEVNHWKQRALIAESVQLPVTPQKK